MTKNTKIHHSISTYLIICNGELKKSELRNILRKTSFDKIICCDGASNRLKEWNLTPDIIIGDMDGSKPETIKYFRNKKVKIKKIYDQNRNDLEKALDLAISEKVTYVIVTGFAGKRLDHTFGNLSILTRYSQKIKQLILYDNDFRGEFIKNERSFKCKKGSVISLLPLPSAFIVKTNGLKWKLKNEKLSLSVKEGTLNKAIGSSFYIHMESGLMLVLFKEE